jgi:ATP-binding cassette subfamily B protein
MVTQNSQVWYYFDWFVAAALVGLLLNRVGIRHTMALQAKVMRDLNDSMFSKLLDRGVGFYNNQIGGKLVSDALDFVNSYGQLFNAGYINAIGFLTTTIVGLGIVFISNWIIGTCITVILIGLTYWTVIETGRRSDMRNERLKISKRLVAHLSDNIVNAVTVKTFARESNELAENQKISKSLSEARLRDWLRSTSKESDRMGVLLLMQVVLIIALIKLTAHDPHLLATGIFAFTYTLTLINRFFSVNTTVRQIEDAFLQASPMTEILQQPLEITDAPGAEPLMVKEGQIVYDEVTFRYADATKQDAVFNGLRLAVHAGEKVGLVGHSGGGKTTLTRLLLRFDDVTSGSISIDGQNISSVTQTSLRQQISYVPQEPLLFHRSVRENIAYGHPEATEKAIEQAAMSAYANDFIATLPKGYDTTVGERGVKLSGGQRQRIAIARAMLKNAPILVLDEATSALDSESEVLIQQALWKLMEGRTAIVIAHRLSTIQKMDRIIVLDNGRIAEEGSHKELVGKKDGTYARLWAHQSGGFIEE